MSDITVNGLTFEPYIKREEIAKQVQRVADEIKRDCQTNCPLFLCVLNGAYMFAADLYRSIDINTSEITFIRFKSYEGTSSTGAAKEIVDYLDSVQAVKQTPCVQVTWHNPLTNT